MLKKLAYIVIITTLIYFIYTSLKHDSSVDKHSYYRINNKGNGTVKLNQSISDVLTDYNVANAKTKDEASIFFMEKFSDHHIFEIIKKIPNYNTTVSYTHLTLPTILLV